jgi:hypothetical protein
MLSHVCRQHVVAERVKRRDEPDQPARHGDVPAHDLAGPHLHAAAGEDAQRAQVEPLGGEQRDDDARIELHARQCGAT